MNLLCTGKLTLCSIGSVFNAAPDQTKQAEVEVWAKEYFPHLWSELETIGMRTARTGRRFFNIDRQVDP